MWKVSALFGLLLIGLSIVTYAIAASDKGTATDVANAPSAAESGKADPEVAKSESKVSPTLFIPAGFGVVLLVCGVLAKAESRRKHAMHAAAAVALIGGLVAGGRGASKIFAAADPTKPANHLATASVWLMTILCLLFVALCVRSFIAARKARQAAG